MSGGRLQFDHTNGLDWRFSLGKPRGVVGAALLGAFILISALWNANRFPFSIIIFYWLIPLLTFSWSSPVCVPEMMAMWAMHLAMSYWVYTHTIEQYSMSMYVSVRVRKAFLQRRTSSSLCSTLCLQSCFHCLSFSRTKFPFWSFLGHPGHSTVRCSILETVLVDPHVLGCNTDNPVRSCALRRMLRISFISN